MENEIVLAPEELYYLGSILQAKYIDYAYIAAMEDIGPNYTMFENETRDSLVRAGALMEDFSGNLEVDKGLLGVIKPIFFGEVETSIDICKLGEENSVCVYKFHFLDGAITMVTGDSGKLAIRSIDQIYIKDIVCSLIPEEYRCTAPEVVTEIDKSKVTRFMAAKSVVVGHASAVKTFIETSGIWYKEKDNETIESVTRDLFISDVYDIVKGV